MARPSLTENVRTLETRMAWLTGDDGHNGVVSQVRADIDDHEKRLRAIERAVIKASAIAGLVAAVASVVVNKLL